MSAVEVMTSGCAVCRQPLTDESRCSVCDWLVTGQVQLGALTSALADRFAARLLAAQRDFDLSAAARAAGYPEHGDDALLDRLIRLARGGPASPADVAGAVGRVREQSELPPAAALPADGTPGRLLRVDADGVQAVTFEAHTDDAGVVEQADVTEWAWPDIVPALPTDPAERRFRLAGGIGSEPLDPATVPASLDVWLDSLPRSPGPMRVFLGEPAWPIPRALAEAVERRHGARRVGAAARRGATGRRTVLRAPAGVTALAAVERTDRAATVACGCASGDVLVWVLPGTGPLRVGGRDPGRVTAVDLSTDGVLVTGNWDGGVRVRHVDGADARPIVLHAHGGRVNAVVARPGVVLSVGDDARIRRTVLDGAAPPTSARFPLADLGSAVQILAATPDGATFAAPAGGGDVRMWRDATGERVPAPAVDGTVTALAFDASGDRIAVATADGTVALYTVVGNRLLALLDGHGAAVRAVAVAGDRAVTGDELGILRRWYLGGGRRTPQGRPFGVHGAAARVMALIGDDLLLTAGAAEKMIRVWRPPGPDDREGYE